MKFIYFYYFTEREYEANSDEELAELFKISIDEVKGACDFAKTNGGICIIGNDPYAAISKKNVLFYAKTREDMLELFDKRYKEMLNGSAN